MKVFLKLLVLPVVSASLLMGADISVVDEWFIFVPLVIVLNIGGQALIDKLYKK